MVAWVLCLLRKEICGIVFLPDVQMLWFTGLDHRIEKQGKFSIKNYVDIVFQFREWNFHWKIYWKGFEVLLFFNLLESKISVLFAFDRAFVLHFLPV